MADALSTRTLDGRAHTALANSGLKRCDLCTLIFDNMKGGYRRHRRSCEAHHERTAPLPAVQESNYTDGPISDIGGDDEMVFNTHETFTQFHEPYLSAAQASSTPTSPQPASVTRGSDAFSEPHVRIVHHPSSRYPEERILLSDYIKQSLAYSLPSSSTFLQEWWHPFRSEADFDFAEFVSDTQLSNSQIDGIIDRMQSVWSTRTHISFKNHRELQKAIKEACSFEKHIISGSYKSIHQEAVIEEFPVHVRSLMEWILEMIRDPEIARIMNRYPVRKSLVIDGIETPFSDDLESGTDWWDIQSDLGYEGIYIPLIVYADATNITRFNNVSFHPVVLRLAGIPASIRNGYKRGGGTLIGYIPVINAPQEEKKRIEFKTFRRRIYHQAMDAILSSITTSSHYGHAVVCGDRIVRVLFAGIYILSADFEEQSYLALTRGPHSLRPCTVCLVPSDDLVILTNSYERRTASQSKGVFTQYRDMKTRRGFRAVAANLLKEDSLRPVKSVFWKLGHSDPHSALTYDLLHFFEGGIVSHYLEAIYNFLGQNGTDTRLLTVIDDRFSELPPWPGYHRIPQITHMTFADSMKRLSVLNRILPCISDLFTPESWCVLRGLRLLGCIRAILGIELITELHIEEGERLIRDFSALLPDIALVLSKDFGFIKMHYLSHAFEHIRRKGPPRHSNTTLGEHGHVFLKEDFALTNGRQTEAQLVKINDIRAALRTIRSRQLSDTISSESPHVSISYPRLGSKLRRSHILVLEADNHGSRIFRQIQSRLLGFLNYNARECQRIGESGNITDLDHSGKITIFRAVKVLYYNLSNLQNTTEIIRCHPLFHQRPRYDTILVRMCDGCHVFARLHQLFTCSAHSYEWKVGLVTLFKTLELPPSLAVGMRVVREDIDSSFIDVEWIVRRVYMSPTFEVGCDRDYFVNDLVIPDAYLRLRSIEPCL